MPPLGALGLSLVWAGAVAQGEAPDNAPVLAAAASVPETASGPSADYGPTREDDSPSVSVGATNRGRVLRSAHLSASDALFVRTPRNAHGTAELVALIEWAAQEVERQFPSSRLVVGDLSSERGGRLRPHRSHRAGRDADIGFYLVDEADDPAGNERFIRLGRDGTGTDRRQSRTLAFDDARNWAFVAAMMGQDVVPVQYMMVIAPLKARLLEEGARQGAPAWLLHRVEEAVGPRRSGRRRTSYGTHNSHFHVRIYCDREDLERCRDSPPFWDWVTRHPRPARSARRNRASRMRAARMRSSRMRARRSSRMRRSSGMRASRMRRSSGMGRARRRASRMSTMRRRSRRPARMR